MAGPSDPLFAPKKSLTKIHLNLKVGLEGKPKFVPC